MQTDQQPEKVQQKKVQQKTELIRNIWNLFADVYSNTIEVQSLEAAKQGFEKALTLQKKKKNLNILELACGSGQFGKHILTTHSSKIQNLQLFDLSDNMISKTKTLLHENTTKTKKTPNVEIQVQNCEELFFLPPKKIDILIGSLCLHLVNDVNKALNCANYILSDEGYFYASYIGTYDKNTLFNKVAHIFNFHPAQSAQSNSIFHLAEDRKFEMLLEKHELESVYFFEKDLVFDKGNDVFDLIMSWFLNLNILDKDVKGEEYKVIRERVMEVVEEMGGKGEKFVFNTWNHVVRKKNFIK